jgi:release factor glutamine methyltransferase
VRDFEPRVALFGGKDGLDLYRRLIPQAHSALRLGGLLAMEFGFGQQEPLTALLEGWQDVRFVEDYAGIPRIVLAQRA